MILVSSKCDGDDVFKRFRFRHENLLFKRFRSSASVSWRITAAECIPAFLRGCKPAWARAADSAATASPPPATRRLGTSEKPYISPDPAARHGVRGATRAAIPFATSQHCRRRRGACKHALEDALLDVQRTLSAPPAAPSPPHPVAACSPLRETLRQSCMTAR